MHRDKNVELDPMYTGRVIYQQCLYPLSTLNSYLSDVLMFNEYYRQTTDEGRAEMDKRYFAKDKIVNSTTKPQQWTIYRHNSDGKSLSEVGGSWTIYLHYGMSEEITAYYTVTCTAANTYELEIKYPLSQPLQYPPTGLLISGTMTAVTDFAGYTSNDLFTNNPLITSLYGEILLTDSYNSNYTLLLTIDPEGLSPLHNTYDANETYASRYSGKFSVKAVDTAKKTTDVIYVEIKSTSMVEIEYHSDDNHTFRGNCTYYGDRL